MALKTLYIVRHGQTDFNKKDIVQGSGVDSDLNEFGYLQAECFYDAYCNVNFDEIYTSKLKRTMQSVKGFLEKNIPHFQLAGLNEISWGVLEGMPNTVERTRIFDQIQKDWINGLLGNSVEGGESPQEMYKRQRISIDKILNSDAQKILIASHGRAIRSLMCILTNVPLVNMYKFPHSNLGLYVLQQKPDGSFEIEVKNDRKHLEEISSHCVK